MTHRAPKAPTPISAAPPQAPSHPSQKPSGRKGFAPDVREAVIVATLKALDSKGLAGLKARAIAQEAGISVGSIYNLFGDLDELARIANGRIYDELYAIEMGALKAARAEGWPPLEQMLALAAAYLDFVKHNQNRWLAVLAFNRGRSEPPPRWYLEKELSLFQIIHDAISTLPAAEDPRAQRLHARALWASIHGIATLAVADGFLMQPIDEVWEQMKIVVTSVARSLERPATS